MPTNFEFSTATEKIVQLVTMVTLCRYNITYLNKETDIDNILFKKIWLTIIYIKNMIIKNKRILIFNI